MIGFIALLFDKYVSKGSIVWAQRSIGLTLINEKSTSFNRCATSCDSFRPRSERFTPGARPARIALALADECAWRNKTIRVMLEGYPQISFASC
jgi:hypothetical protein